MKVPRMVGVCPVDDMNIIVTFDGDIKKKYDIKRLFDKFPIFRELQNEELFKRVIVDVGGFGVVWNEYIDLSRYEIWENGEDFVE